MTETPYTEAPDQAPPLITTMALARATITSVTRTCRGQIGSMHIPRDATPAQRVATEQELRSKIIQLMKTGDMATAKALDTDTRRPCGYDFNETILSGPFDGQEHAYECPSCGLTGTYRAPIFPDIREKS